MEVVPVNFGLKYNPPKLGVQYHMKDQPNAHFVHEIPLGHLSPASNLESVAKEILSKNKFYMNPKVVSMGQIRRLLDKLVKTVHSRGENKENRDQRPNGSKLLEERKKQLKLETSPPSERSQC